MSDTATPPAPNSNRHDAVPGGLQDDPGASALQEGDFGLDGDLRATMLAALEQKWNADDPGATTLDDADPADGAGQPSPATPSTVGSPPRVEDGDGGGGDAGEGAAPGDPTSTAPAPPQAPATPDDFSLDDYARSYFGTNLTRDQAHNLFATLNGLQSLTPQQRAELDRVLAGGAPNQYPATTGEPVQPITPGQVTPTPPATSPQSPYTLPARPDDEYEASIYDKYIAPLASATNSQLATIQSQIAHTTAQQLAREQEARTREIEAAASEWRSSHPLLTDGEYDALADQIIRSEVFPALIRTHGSASAATNAALEQFFWANPQLRERAIANLASGRGAGDGLPDPNSPAASQQANADAQRQGRAASVAGGGGSTSTRGATPTPTTPEARKQAMIQALAESGDFG